jgi:hypothetical protein
LFGTRPFKISVLVFALVAVAGTLLAIAAERVYVLRAEDAPYVVAKVDKPGIVTVYGRMIHSGLATGPITTARDGDHIILRVYLVAPGPHPRNDFTVHIAIPDGVHEVWFGDPSGRLTVAQLFGRSLQVPRSFSAGKGRVVWTDVRQ